MTQIRFIEASGKEHAVTAPDGDSVMQVAVSNAVPGIIADCGGNCSCATCHVYIEAPWNARVPAPSDQERDMIDCALHVQENSRLSCQVMVSADLDGMVVRIPVSQI